jgi:hypothetical protein
MEGFHDERALVEGMPGGGLATEEGISKMGICCERKEMGEVDGA